MEQTVDARTSPEEAMRAARAAMDAMDDRVEVAAPPLMETGPNPNVTLPGGLLHEDHGLITTAVVRELTGADEEKLARVDNNGQLKTTLLECGVVSLGDVPVTKDLLNELSIGDRESLLVAVRIAAFGPTVSVPVYLPQTQEMSEAVIDLRTIESKTIDDLGPYHVELPSGRIATVELATGEDEAKANALTDKGKTLAEVNSFILGECVTDISGDDFWLGTDSARDLPVRDRRFLIQYLSDAQPGPRLNDVTYTPEGYDTPVACPVSLLDLFRA